jgi:hypothetical protein
MPTQYVAGLAAAKALVSYHLPGTAAVAAPAGPLDGTAVDERFKGALFVAMPRRQQEGEPPVSLLET